jgi:hypothetical protein
MAGIGRVRRSVAGDLISFQRDRHHYLPVDGPARLLVLQDSR